MRSRGSCGAVGLALALLLSTLVARDAGAQERLAQSSPGFQRLPDSSPFKKGEPGSYGVEAREMEARRVEGLLAAPRNLYSASVALGITRRKEESASAGDPWFGAGASIHCNGVLVRAGWVVTTAHCVKETPRTQLAVFAGSNDLATAKVFRVVRVEIHPQYNRIGRNGDIALLQLAEPPAIPSLRISRTPFLPSRDETSPGGFVVAGWGYIRDTAVGPFPTSQKHLTVRAFPRDECRARYPGEEFPSDNICAASGFSGFDVCSGFSGAALMAPTRSGKLELRGIVAWGSRCEALNSFTAYVDVTQYDDWIARTTGMQSSAAHRFAARPNDLTRAFAQDLSLPWPAQYTLSQKPLDPFAPTAQPTNDVGPRIGGDVNLAPVGLFRYVVSLSHAGRQPTLGHFCGGILIRRDWILTAAHCVNQVKAHPAKIQIKIDTEKLSTGGILLDKTDIKEIIVHERFEQTVFRNFRNDVALVRIDPAKVPNDLVPVTMLAGPLTDDTGSEPIEATVVGWGKNSSSRFGQVSDVLRWVSVSVMNRTICNGASVYSGLIDDTVICAGGGADGADSCQGDSGGPLLVVNPNRDFEVAGLVSWGDGCGKPNRPGVYMSLPAYVDWLKDKIKPSPTADATQLFTLRRRSR